MCFKVVKQKPFYFFAIKKKKMQFKKILRFSTFILQNLTTYIYNSLLGLNQHYQARIEKFSP